MKTPSWFLKKNFAAYALLPIAVLYYLISKTVYICRSFGQKTSKRPVICIGNILAGGVGKTPIVMQVAKRLSAPVVMRGYKRKKESEIRNQKLGDEATMMKNYGIDVYVGNRAKNIAILNQKSKITNHKSPIVMDDGFQNPTVKKDVSVLVFDEKIGVGNGFILPAGPLREPMCAIRRADAVIVIRNQKSEIRNQEFMGKITRYEKPVFFATNRNIMPKGAKRTIAFAGIGYPQKFFEALDDSVIDTYAFPDHYEYKKTDIRKLLRIAKKHNASLVTTAKDWVRLPEDIQNRVRVAKLETVIEPAFWTWLGDKLK